MTAALPIADAAKLARTTVAEVQAALDSGDLRNLTRRAVLDWARARTAATVTRALHP